MIDVLEVKTEWTDSLKKSKKRAGRGKKRNRVDEKKRGGKKEKLNTKINKDKRRKMTRNRENFKGKKTLRGNGSKDTAQVEKKVLREGL